MMRDAQLSQDLRYRIWLTRSWDAAGTQVCFIGLNPSTADALNEDPTLRRCIGFAKEWGHGSLLLLNLFARRTPSPAQLWKMQSAGEDIVGPLSTAALIQSAAQAQQVVACWGAAQAARPRGREVSQMLANAGIPVHAIQRTKGGDPGHPLYLKKGLRPVPWTPTTGSRS